jgi:plasmid stabilization system protein ParE
VRFYLSAEAEEDFLRIYRFNVERSLAWADRVERRLLERIWALESAPLSGRLHTRDGVRRVSVADIQYVIDYRIGTAAIEIMRIRHTREIR